MSKDIYMQIFILYVSICIGHYSYVYVVFVCVCLLCACV